MKCTDIDIQIKHPNELIDADTPVHSVRWVRAVIERIQIIWAGAVMQSLPVNVKKTQCDRQTKRLTDEPTNTAYIYFK